MNNLESLIANPKSIIKGEKYRITVLTERLIRLEYSLDGNFEDGKTEIITNRNLPPVKFDLKQDNNILIIQTNYFKLTYLKEKSFDAGKVNPANNLKVELLNTDKFWYHNHPEIRNFKIPSGNLAEEITASKGLYSEDGIASIDDSKSYIFKEGKIYKNENRIDTYLFMYNNDFEKALEDYYKVTGYPALLPRYALGNWWSRNIDYNDLTLKQLVDTFEQEEIPLSIVLLNKNWHTRYQNLDTGFTFNGNYFKNPKAMINYLHQKNIHLGLNINPLDGFYSVDPVYQEVKKYLQEEKDHIPFNVLNPNLIDIYFKMYIHPLDDLGVDFFHLDTINPNSLLTHYHFEDMKRDFKRRPFILSNGNVKAPHRYPATYSGKTSVNWSTIKKIPFYNNNSFNNGSQFLANDTGGYYKGTEDSELYIRWIQLGVFSPILKLNAEKGKYYKREPWRWDIKTYTIVKDYLKLRHKLIPYIYSEAYKYHKFGTQIIKPLYYTNKEYYDDVLYRNEYYFGQSLFIAPITTQKDYVMDRVVHNFYLPKGMWYDFVTGKKFPGGQSYISFFKDQDYPVFAKQGAIIPLGYNENINDITPPKNMEINIFPGQSNTYTLFEDDGESDLYRKDFYLLTQIDYNYLPNNYSVIIRAVEGKSSIVPDERNYKIIFRNTKRTDDVTVYSNRDSLPFKTYVDGPNFIVEVNNVKTIGQLTINCKGKDIEIDAVRLVNEELETIISDLQISTELKEKIDKVIFSKEEIRKKRIAIRKLGKDGLEKKFIKMFLKLLDYINTI